jgi:hypothetical protein
MSAGNTRPEVPTKVAMPSPSDQARTAGPSKAATTFRSMSLGGVKRCSNVAVGSECVRFKPPRPARRNLRPTDGMAS